jgi:LacI family transcriptional regulator
MASRPNVALVIETSVVYGRQILRGIARYLRVHRPWSVFLDERELWASPPNWLNTWQGDGVISRANSPELIETLSKHNTPLVDLNDWFNAEGVPHIDSDMPAIGRMATEHLLERGFRNIAYCGFQNERWSTERFNGVEEAVRGQGNVCGVFNSDWRGLREHAWQEERDQIAKWLQSLPRPLGIVACNDVRGQHVLDACRQLDIAVPEEIAVIGTDNAETFCELCSPRLSSVVPNARRIGYEAAALLDRLMAGEQPPYNSLRIPPIGVITRQSTDILAIEDPDIATAVRFIREHACKGICVDDVIRQVPLSRSVLERGFRRYIGRSPQKEIRQTQIKHIKRLLLETDWPLERIAELTGFEYPEYMMVLFKREVGQTPTEYRHHHQSYQQLWKTEA